MSVSVYNSPCLRMSELQPKTAKPPLVRHAVRTRDRHDFGTLEIRIDLRSSGRNSDESWPPLSGFGDVVRSHKNRRYSGAIMIPAPARGRLCCPPRACGVDSAGSLAGRPATDHRLPATIAFGLTRRDAACPGDTASATKSPSLQAIAFDDRPRFARAAAPGARRTGTCGAP